MCSSIIVTRACYEGYMRYTYLFLVQPVLVFIWKIFAILPRMAGVLKPLTVSNQIEIL